MITLLCLAAAALTPDAVDSDLTLLEEALERIHPGYTRYTELPELQARWQRIRDDARADDGMTESDFYLAVQEGLVAIRCDHTKAEIPKSLATRLREEPMFLPFAWTVVEGRAIVTEDYEGLKRGDEMLTLDGRAVSEVLETVRPFVPYDGATEWAREEGLAGSLEFLGGAVDHFGAFLWEVPPVAALEVQRSGDSLPLEVARVPYPDWAERYRAQGASSFRDGVHLEMLEDGVALLTIDTFVNYRDPVRPAKLLKPVFERLEAEHTKVLVVDLRGNGGGSGDAQRELIRGMIHQPIRLARRLEVNEPDLEGLKEHLWSWEPRAVDPPGFVLKREDDGSHSIRPMFSADLRKMRPRRWRFDGEVRFLTGPAMGSASTSLVARMSELGTVTTVGEPTGGSAEGPTAGVLVFLTLPESRLRIRVPVIRYHNDVARFDPGRGVSPDVPIARTAADVIGGADPALEWALKP